MNEIEGYNAIGESQLGPHGAIIHGSAWCCLAKQSSDSGAGGSFKERRESYMMWLFLNMFENKNIQSLKKQNLDLTNRNASKETLSVC